MIIEYVNSETSLLIGIVQVRMTNQRKDGSLCFLTADYTLPPRSKLVKVEYNTATIARIF